MKTYFARQIKSRERLVYFMAVLKSGKVEIMSTWSHGVDSLNTRFAFVDFVKDSYLPRLAEI